ncbi:hypothetical protein GGX14DRAFT_638448 [Mycena pura]|uniref:Uncharacterized protein n=1 Tax=Mycena pura TaxID=153505 RepID=A0AAD7E2M3_9AGAR|nr:hypothetical protein GGX14DRAFT_638448 [Mycena pura]
MPLPTRREMQEMKRPELQKLCKDYGVKANLKTDALIELLLDTKFVPNNPANSTQPLSRKPNPRTAVAAPPPPTRRSVSTRHASRSAPRISSVIIHDTDDEQEEENDHEIDQEETENKPEPDPDPRTIPTRSRKAKDTQTRLGVGRPVAAGGNGPRAVTKSISVVKGKRGRNSKAVKPAEETIPEEIEEEQPLQGQLRHPQPPAVTSTLLDSAGPSDLTVTASTATHNISAPEPSTQATMTTNGSAAFAGAVADALQPVYQQLQSLRSELQKLPALQTELAQLRKQVADMQSLEHKVATLTTQVETLSAQPATITALEAEVEEANMVSTSPRLVPNPSTPRFHSPVPRPSSAAKSKTAHGIKNVHLPNPGIAPSMLGKRSRDSTSSNLTGVIEEDQQGDLSEEELARKVLRPTKKRAKLQEEEADDIQGDDEPGPSTSRVPSFTVYSGEEESYVDPPPPTQSLPEFYTPSSPGPQQGTTTSTQNASENQHPFTFAFLPISSTPAHSTFVLPNFPYPEAPQSPSPSGPSNGGPARNHGERTDIFQPFGLPPPSRPRSRVTSAAVTRQGGETAGDIGAFVDPAALTRRPSDKEREDAAASFGFALPPSTDMEGQASLKRTMYGTELDGDTRFGDFGLEGVASGFWTGNRFP